jgi:hypothetical protein
MNGEYDIDIVSDVLNQPDLQENYPIDFTGYMYEEPSAPLPEEPVYEVSPAQRIQVWAQSPQGQTEEPTDSNALVDLFGNVLNVVGKTYQQIATQKEVQNLKSTPYVTSALNTLGYPSIRTPQTGIDKGILTTSGTAITKALSSMSPMVLILGVGILAFVMMGLGRK